ncbi:nucleotide exchange factor GrpE [Streptomyces sp. NPDC005279]|uniref:nucleotide exchange factor GrpE n=1 Tax=Streptomyces sp. NPDC005279 TaxID=3364712 RepID=UPI0036B83142
MNRPDDVRGSSDQPLVIVRGRPCHTPATLLTRTRTHTRTRHGEERTERDGAGQDRTVEQPPPDETGLGAELRERTADLQRLKAEYDNYRKRVRRDRLAVREIAVANVLGRLLPVLDALAEAAEQGEVTGGFQRIALELEEELAGLGLQSFGEAGDLFDPVVHEAIRYTGTGSGQVEHAICAAVLRKGYRVGDHLLRPAQVEVTEPQSTDAPAA